MSYLHYLHGHLLTLLVLAPVLGAAVVALTRREAALVQKVVALAWSTGVFVLSLGLVRGMKPAAGYQFLESAAWIPAYGITYHVGIDGISYWLILLTTFLTPLALLGAWNYIDKRVREFVVFMLLLEAAGVVKQEYRRKKEI